MYVTVEAEMKSVDDFPTYEVGETIQRDDRAFVLSVFEAEGKSSDYIVSAGVDDADDADYDIIVELIDENGGAEYLYEVLPDVLENSDLVYCFDYNRLEHVLAKKV